MQWYIYICTTEKLAFLKAPQAPLAYRIVFDIWKCHFEWTMRLFKCARELSLLAPFIYIHTYIYCMQRERANWERDERFAHKSRVFYQLISFARDIYIHTDTTSIISYKLSPNAPAYRIYISAKVSFNITARARAQAAFITGNAQCEISLAVGKSSRARENLPPTKTALHNISNTHTNNARAIKRGNIFASVSREILHLSRIYTYIRMYSKNILPLRIPLYNSRSPAASRCLLPSFFFICR